MGRARAAAAWGAPQRQAIERVFTASGSPSAAHAFATTAALVDDYVGRWTQLYTETCEATHVRGDQSAEVLDLRMACLGERLASVRALGEVLAGADARAIDNAVAAASGLPMLARCSDVAMLRAVVSPPEDPAIRARVDALREEGARLSVLTAAGQCERASAAGEKLITAAAAVGYMPLVAEAEMVLGRLGEICTDAAKSAEHLEQASFAAEISHHDQVVIEAAVFASALPPTVARSSGGAPLAAARRGGPRPLSRASDPRGVAGEPRSIMLVRAGDTAPPSEENRRELALLERCARPIISTSRSASRTSGSPCSRTARWRTPSRRPPARLR